MKFIAEIGVNHNGSLKKAKQMILEAKKMGADIVKFQSYKTDLIIDKKTPKAKYQATSLSNKRITQYSMLKNYELSFVQQKKIINFCKKKKIEYLASVFDNESLKFNILSGLKKIKIPSGELNNFILLMGLKNFKGEILISVGMATTREIKKTLDFLKKIKIKKRKIILMYCVSDYPSKVLDINLNSIPYLRKKFHVNVGFSDHSLGVEFPIAAMTLKINYLEKHVTLDKNDFGPDHKASLEFSEFGSMIRMCKNILKTLKKFEKKNSINEKLNAKVVRKKIFAKKNIKKNEKFSFNNLTAKRFNKGISIGKLFQIINKKSKKFFFKDELIKI